MDKENVIKFKHFYLGKYVGITVFGNISNRLGVCGSHHNNTEDTVISLGL
jgi:hypothetical protein